MKTENIEASTQARASKEIGEDQDLEHLRATAAFYLRLTQDLKRARDADNIGTLRDVRSGCFLMAGLFALGALLAFAGSRPGGKQPKDPAAGTA